MSARNKDNDKKYSVGYGTPLLSHVSKPAVPEIHVDGPRASSIWQPF